jgi:hypothetical protein
LGRLQKIKSHVLSFLFEVMTSTTSSPANNDAHFTIANIPFGIASRKDGNPQAATRLLGFVYFIPEMISHGLLTDLDDEIVGALVQVFTLPRFTLA